MLMIINHEEQTVVMFQFRWSNMTDSLKSCTVLIRMDPKTQLSVCVSFIGFQCRKTVVSDTITNCVSPSVWLCKVHSGTSIKDSFLKLYEDNNLTGCCHCILLYTYKMFYRMERVGRAGLLSCLCQ